MKKLVNNLTTHALRCTGTTIRNPVNVNKIVSVEVQGQALHLHYLEPKTRDYGNIIVHENTEATNKYVVQYQNSDILKQDVEQIRKKQAILKSIYELDKSTV